jgi:hypothetical protein
LSPLVQLFVDQIRAFTSAMAAELNPRKVCIREVLKAPARPRDRTNPIALNQLRPGLSDRCGRV